MGEGKYLVRQHEPYCLEDSGALGEGQALVLYSMFDLWNLSPWNLDRPRIPHLPLLLLQGDARRTTLPISCKKVLRLLSMAVRD